MTPLGVSGSHSTASTAGPERDTKQCCSHKTATILTHSSILFLLQILSMRDDCHPYKKTRTQRNQPVVSFKIYQTKGSYDSEMKCCVNFSGNCFIPNIRRIQTEKMVSFFPSQLLWPNTMIKSTQAIKGSCSTQLVHHCGEVKAAEKWGSKSRAKRERMHTHLSNPGQKCREWSHIQREVFPRWLMESKQHCTGIAASQLN